MPRPILRKPPAYSVDDDFFYRLPSGVQAKLSNVDREAIRLIVEDANALRNAQEVFQRKIGRTAVAEMRRVSFEKSKAAMTELGIEVKAKRPPKSVNLHALVYSLLEVLDIAGVDVTGAKEDEGGKVYGDAADFLRVTYGALCWDGRSISADGFARLVIEAWRQPRAKARKAREDYDERTLNAWKNPR